MWRSGVRPPRPSSSRPTARARERSRPGAFGESGRVTPHRKSGGPRGTVPCMKTRIGLWIDHRKAVVVAMADNGEETTVTITSKVERQPGRFDGNRSTTRHEAQQVPADDSRQRRFTGQLDIYYDAVVACVRNAETILIFGPGEASSKACAVQAGIVGTHRGGRNG